MYVVLRFQLHCNSIVSFVCWFLVATILWHYLWFIIFCVINTSLFADLHVTIYAMVRYACSLVLTPLLLPIPTLWCTLIWFSLSHAVNTCLRIAQRTIVVRGSSMFVVRERSCSFMLFFPSFFFFFPTSGNSCLIVFSLSIKSLPWSDAYNSRCIFCGSCTWSVTQLEILWEFYN